MSDRHGFDVGVNDLREPEPDPKMRRYAFRVDIEFGHKTVFDPDGRPIPDRGPERPSRPARTARKCRTDRIIREMRAKGVTDPGEMAVAAGVGIEAVQRRLRKIKDGRSRRGQGEHR